MQQVQLLHRQVLRLVPLPLRRRERIILNMESGTRNPALHQSRIF